MLIAQTTSGFGSREAIKHQRYGTNRNIVVVVVVVD